MSIPGGPDPTLPAGGPGAPPGADPTMPVTRQVPGGYGGPGGPAGGGGYGGGENGDDGDNRRLWMIAGGVLIAGILVGGLIALLASGGDSGSSNGTTTSSSASSSTSSSTSTSTSTSTSSTSTTTTQAAPGPQITSFTVNPNLVNCGNPPGSITLTWTTANATGVSVSVDPPGVFGNYGPSDTQPFPFSCSKDPQNPDVNPSHTYQLTANGQNGQKVSKQIVLMSFAPPPGP